ncbi:hypothetical protein AR158_c617R [Paramecium bursaria Chlorella virus AR158]|uniref:hypothetical protein n=1 Tax=Paramecium bursaria Chlorella virus AR158 TaxID=380598 RepID=UPI00015AA7D2|nr:hypothetical protein AR158_c617R [Paramecium bursaria Chlorella virus AR158]ABU44162.1 hypothetical protein AR158_c617R [Paramecium bursaria Chlorella virus AR158]
MYFEYVLQIFNGSIRHDNNEYFHNYFFIKKFVIFFDFDGLVIFFDFGGLVIFFDFDELVIFFDFGGLVIFFDCMIEITLSFFLTEQEEEINSILFFKTSSIFLFFDPA